VDTYPSRIHEDKVRKHTLMIALIIMKTMKILAIAGILISTTVLGQAEPVKMSKSGICHAPNTTYYNQTKNFTPYPTLKDCLSAGGRMPKK
jgi:hypothetical protein